MADGERLGERLLVVVQGGEEVELAFVLVDFRRPSALLGPEVLGDVKTTLGCVQCLRSLLV